MFFGGVGFFWGGIELVVKKNWNTKLNTGPLFGGDAKICSKRKFVGYFGRLGEGFFFKSSRFDSISIYKSYIK